MKTEPRWTEIGFARVGDLLASRTGLHFAASRQASAEQAMLRAMSDLGIGDAGEYAARITRDRAALDALLAEITIGETYFFRESAQLEYLRRSVLPTFRASRGPDRPLRVWSAGCATGEEPYTLGIILHEDWPHHQRPRILGTEISRPRIAAARRARYTKWSLRGLAEPVVRRYFSERGKHFTLHPGIRAMVDFDYLNLAEPTYPGGKSVVEEMDVVLCRNVLIYFDRETVAAVATRLLASLSEDGWLFLGASDPAIFDMVPCEVVITGAGLAYRRKARRMTGAVHAPPVTLLGSAVTQGLYASLLNAEAQDAPDEPPSSGTAYNDHADAGAPHEVPVLGRDAGADRDERELHAAAARAAYGAREYRAAVQAIEASLRLGAADPTLHVMRVRALANLGALADAGRACAAALDHYPTAAELVYLHALLLSEAGALEDAARAARQALYLDRRLVVAHMLLGGVLARLGDAAGARRSFVNVEELLRVSPPDAEVPASDGEPVRRVRESARTQYRLLSEAVR